MCCTSGANAGQTNVFDSYEFDSFTVIAESLAKLHEYVVLNILWDVMSSAKVILIRPAEENVVVGVLTRRLEALARRQSGLLLYGSIKLFLWGYISKIHFLIPVLSHKFLPSFSFNN